MIKKIKYTNLDVHYLDTNGEAQTAKVTLLKEELRNNRATVAGIIERFFNVSAQNIIKIVRTSEFTRTYSMETRDFIVQAREVE